MVGTGSVARLLLRRQIACQAEQGLVNLDIINTPLTGFFSFFLYEQRNTEERVRNTHVDVHQRVNDIGAEAVQWLNLHGKDISVFSCKM